MYRYNNKMTDFYKVLEVDEKATQEDIKKSYRSYH